MSGVQVLQENVAASVVERLPTCLTDVSAQAEAIDCGETDVRASLTQLGAAGLLSLGAAGYEGTLTDQAYVIRSLARVCLSSAFATWAQRMAIGYIAKWGSEVLKDQLLHELVSGQRPGATAMATAFQDALGLRDVPITLERHDGHVVLNGTIPWASNLFADGAVVVLPARDRDGSRLIVAITTDLDGVELPAYPPLMALGSTASTSVRLRNVTIPAEWVLTDKFADFLADVRPPFLLLQTAFCLGLTDAALAGADGPFDGLASVFAADHTQLVATRDDLERNHQELLVGSGPAGEAHLRLRLSAGTLACEASRHESKVRGGAGFLAHSPVARRLRESTFLPIQSPTEAQLRWELQHFV